MSLLFIIKRQILWDLNTLTNHLIMDASRLSTAQLIPRLAIFLIALALNRLLPSPLAILIVTVFTILVVKWQTVSHMSDHGAVVDSALYFVYLITTIVGEWMQKKKLTKENHRLTQEKGELEREKEQLVQDNEQLAQDKEHLQHNPPHLGTTLLAKLRPSSVLAKLRPSSVLAKLRPSSVLVKLRPSSVKLAIAMLILAVAGCALATWWSFPAVAHQELVHLKAADFCNCSISVDEKWEQIYGKVVPRTYRQLLDQEGTEFAPYYAAEELLWEAHWVESGYDSD